MNTLLIGPRGCGKSTVGRALSKRLGHPFVELDERVLAAFGEGSVREVWSVHGEAAWREAESAALVATLAADEQVIALGGGTPMVAAARQRIEADREAGRARVIYLRCSSEVLAHRLAAAPGDRPSLTGADLPEEAATVLAAREPTYRGLADLECDADRGSPDQIADEIAVVR